MYKPNEPINDFIEPSLKYLDPFFSPGPFRLFNQIVLNIKKKKSRENPKTERISMAKITNPQGLSPFLYTNTHLQNTN